jgi:hypothetical protein
MLYTQHTVSGGGGSQIRVYKVDPVTLTQTTVKATNTNLYVFNGAVSTDRAVDTGAEPATARFGDGIVLGFNTSSPVTPVTIQMIAQIDSGAKSRRVQVLQSPSPDNDQFCQQVCPWGRYVSATPDPTLSGRALHGVVWLTGEWVGPPAGGSQWRSWNWSARP